LGAKKADARRKWFGQINAWKEERPYDRIRSDEEIRPQHLMDEIDRLSGGQAIVTSDVGQHQMWAAQLIGFNEPRLWINSGGLGAMGFGVPSAMGAQMARPDKLVFAICGDGGFQMSIPELATIASQGLPIKIICMNNGYLGMVRQWQEFFYERNYEATPMVSPDFVKLADAHGIAGLTVSTRAEVESAVAEARSASGAFLLNFMVEKEDSVYPMIPVGASLHEMIRRPGNDPLEESPEDV
jgi:acetolactate synthase-1/2/3 large subunit